MKAEEAVAEALVRVGDSVVKSGAGALPAPGKTQVVQLHVFTPEGLFEVEVLVKRVSLRVRA